MVSAASAAQVAAGNVNISMAISLLIGSIPGVLLGSRLAIGFPEQILRFSLATVLLISGAKKTVGQELFYVLGIIMEDSFQRPVLVFFCHQTVILAL